MKSIQSKILVVVIAGLLVITAVVSLIAVGMTHEIMHRDADRILKNATEREAAYINDVLGDIVKSCSVMEHYSITELPSAESLKDEAFRAQYLKSAETMFTEIALNTTGIEGFFMRIDPLFSNSTTGFYNLINPDKSIKSMGITDLDKYDKNDKQNVGWYYEAVSAGHGIWLDPYVFPGNDDTTLITYAQPLYVNRELIGVIGFDMNFDSLVERINNISLYEEGYALLLAKDGKTSYNEAPKDAEHSHGHGPHTQSKVELKNGMFMIIQADYKDIQKDIRPMLYQIVFAFVLVLLISIIYTVVVTRKIVRPLKQLTAAAENLSEGVEKANLVQIPINSKDEVGVLSRALSNTYAKIQEYTSYINALAYRDSLTGIKNSTAYTEAIAELNREILTGKPKFGVLVADINNLKQTNDRFGHDIGNDLIIHTSKILLSTFENSAVYRIGGDEFAVILKDNDYKNYRALLERMDEACSHDFITVCENTIPVSVARGVSLYEPSIDHVYEDVFSKADHAMYLHKDETKAALV